MNLSVLVGCLNNLDYTQHFYKTFRKVYPTVELVFVSYGSDDGTNEWFQSLDDVNTIRFHSSERKTFSDTYNKAIELATKDYVTFLHNDIVVATGFLENIEKHLHQKNVVSYTTIEPPIFAGHERPGKIIRDFGSNLDDFNSVYFEKFHYIESNLKYGKTEPGITFFMALSRQILLNMGGFDNKFNPYFCEDDDLIKRLKLQELNCFTSLDAICYHFVSKTSRFTEEAKQKTQQIEQNSNRTFLRKWGSFNSNNLFNVGFDITNADFNTIHHLEPWCSTIYTDYSDVKKYIEEEQKNTWYSLGNKFVDRSEFESTTDIIVSFDATKLNPNRFEFIQNIQNILGEISEEGIYEFDIFRIEVKNLTNYIKDNIYI